MTRREARTAVEEEGTDVGVATSDEGGGTERGGVVEGGGGRR